MPLRRLLSGILLVLAALAAGALLPAAADASPLQPLQSTAVALAEPAQAAAADVAGVGRPVLDAVSAPSRPVESPSAPSGRGPIARTVEPIADGAAATVPPSGATLPPQHLHEPAEAGASRATASASVVRSGGRAEREQGSGAYVGSHPSPRRSVTAHDRAQQVPSAARVASEATAKPLALAPEPSSGPLTDGAGSGASTGFFFGGGFALLVACLLLAGPRLRRGLSMLPAVCRPAAFLLVLERPG